MNLFKNKAIVLSKYDPLEVAPFLSVRMDGCEETTDAIIKRLENALSDALGASETILEIDPIHLMDMPDSLFKGYVTGLFRYHVAELDWSQQPGALPSFIRLDLVESL